VLKNIRTYSQLIGLIALLICQLPAQAQTAPKTLDTIWHRQPATRWNEAFPFGNGRLGGMMFGKVENERIQLNEDSMWSGGVADYYRSNGPAVLKEAQELMFAGEHAAGEKLMQNKFLNVRPLGGTHAYQTLGDLHLTFPKTGKANNYRRELALDQAIARVQYEADGVKFQREIFSSPVDQAIIVRLQCDQPGKLNFDASLSRQHHANVKALGADGLVMTGQVQGVLKKKNPKLPTGETGVRYAAHMKVISTGGSVQFAEGKVSVKDADEVLIIVTAATNFGGDDPLKLSHQQLTAAASKSYTDGLN